MWNEESQATKNYQGISGPSLGSMEDPRNVPVDRGRMGIALQEQEKLISVLHDEIGMLHDRMAGMLRPSAPTADSAGGAAIAPPVAPVTGHIQTQNIKLSGAIARVRDLAARFDL